MAKIFVFSSFTDAPDILPQFFNFLKKEAKRFKSSQKSPPISSAYPVNLMVLEIADGTVYPIFFSFLLIRTRSSSIPVVYKNMERAQTCLIPLLIIIFVLLKILLTRIIYRQMIAYKFFLHYLLKFSQIL